MTRRFCNSCPLKASCTSHGQGRYLYRSLAAWVETDIERFHRRLPLLMVGTASGSGALSPRVGLAVPREPESLPRAIVVTDDEPDMRDYFRKILPRLGHTVEAAAENGVELIAYCRALRPDLVIADIKMPGLDGIDAARKIYEEAPTPVLLISAYSGAKLIERAETAPIMGYLVKPIKQADLEPAISLAMRQFEHFQTRRRQASDWCQELEDRQVIEPPTVGEFRKP